VIIRLSHGATEGNRFFADTAQTTTTIKKNGGKVIHTLLERCTPWLQAAMRCATLGKEPRLWNLNCVWKQLLTTNLNQKRRKFKGSLGMTSIEKNDADDLSLGM